MSILFIPIALALDAFGVSLSLGFSNKYKLKQLMMFCLSFGFFQFLFSLIGGIFGDIVNSYILAIPKVFGGIIILIVGVMMLKESFSGDKDDRDEEELKKNLFNNLYITLGISVSIDALVVGFTAYNIYNFYLIFLNTLLVGVITLLLCVFAVVLSLYLRKLNFIGKYADFLGGIILILFGFRMIFS